MNILVTGAGGFIGGHLVSALAIRGHNVGALDKKTEIKWRQDHGITDNVKQMIQDVVDMGVVWPACDLVFHLAADAGVRESFEKPADYVRNNVVGTAKVLEFAREYGANFIYAGSSTADFNIDANPYALTKYQGEQLVQMYNKIYNMPAAIARFYNVYGPYQSEPGDGNPYCNVMGTFEKQYREGNNLTVTGTGEQRRDFTHVHDIVSGLIAIADTYDRTPIAHRTCQIYNIGTGVNHSILQIAQQFVDDSRIDFIDRPQGEAEVSLADNNRLRSLGWESKINLLEYVRQIKETSEQTCSS